MASKYNKDLPEKLKELMAGGHTFSGACGKLGFSRKTGHAWAKKYPEWAKAKEVGTDMRLAFLENLLKHAVYGLIPEEAKELGATKKLDKILIMFWLKTIHRDLYAERIETENTHQGDMVFKSKIGEGGEVLQEIKSLSDWPKEKNFDATDILIKENKDEIKAPAKKKAKKVKKKVKAK